MYIVILGGVFTTDRLNGTGGLMEWVEMFRWEIDHAESVVVCREKGGGGDCCFLDIGGMVHVDATEICSESWEMKN